MHWSPSYKKARFVSNIKKNKIMSTGACFKNYKPDFLEFKTYEDLKIMRHTTKEVQCQIT